MLVEIWSDSVSRLPIQSYHKEEKKSKFRIDIIKIIVFALSL